MVHIYRSYFETIKLLQNYQVKRKTHKRKTKNKWMTDPYENGHHYLTVIIITVIYTADSVYTDANVKSPFKSITSQDSEQAQCSRNFSNFTSISGEKKNILPHMVYIQRNFCHILKKIKE